jgi:putative SOS response-associated peptidase YedK
VCACDRLNAAQSDPVGYRDRQIAILDRVEWAAWLDPSISSKAILKPFPSGALTVQRVG